jgi:hypothetical protein
MIPDDDYYYIPDDADLDNFELEQAAYDAYLDWLAREEALDEAAYDAYLDDLAREEYVPDDVEEIAAELNRERDAEGSRSSTDAANPPSEPKEVHEAPETEGTDPCRSDP